jgi:MATE family multidrug resistance protein
LGGDLLMLAARRPWARMYTHSLEMMALLEVVNFPLNVCGGIVRGTARPLLEFENNCGLFPLLLST